MELRSPQPSPAAFFAQSSDSAAGVIATLATVELEHIRRVLEQCHGNRTLAAQHLGITRQTLSKKVDTSGEEG